MIIVDDETTESVSASSTRRAVAKRASEEKRARETNRSGARRRVAPTSPHGVARGDAARIETHPEAARTASLRRSRRRGSARASASLAASSTTRATKITLRAGWARPGTRRRRPRPTGSPRARSTAAVGARYLSCGAPWEGYSCSYPLPLSSERAFRVRCHHRVSFVVRSAISRSPSGRASFSVSADWSRVGRPSFTVRVSPSRDFECRGETRG